MFSYNSPHAFPLSFYPSSFPLTFSPPPFFTLLCQLPSFSPLPPHCALARLALVPHSLYCLPSSTLLSSPLLILPSHHSLSHFVPPHLLRLVNSPPSFCLLLFYIYTFSFSAFNPLPFFPSNPPVPPCSCSPVILSHPLPPP